MSIPVHKPNYKISLLVMRHLLNRLLTLEVEVHLVWKFKASPLEQLIGWLRSCHLKTKKTWHEYSNFYVVYLVGAELLWRAWLPANNSTSHSADNRWCDSQRYVARNQIQSFLSYSERTRKPILATAEQIHRESGWRYRLFSLLHQK